MLRATSFNTGNVGITGGTITGTNVPYSLSKTGIPFINLSTASMGNNGALSGATALNLTYDGGAYVWFDTNQIFAGSVAGWYWTVFSSTTAGTVYNSTYTSGTPVAGTTTAFVSTGPGAITGSTSELFGPTITIPANAMGPNGALRSRTTWTINNTVNARTPRTRLGGQAGTVYMAVNLASTVSYSDQRSIENRGVTNRQVGHPSAGLPYAATASIPAISSIDTTASTTLVHSLLKGVATDNLVLESYELDLIYGP